MGFVVRLLARLPLPILHNFGAACGWLAWLLSPQYRQHMVDNLRQAGLLDAHIRLSAIAESGKTMLELPRLWRESQEKNLARIASVEGWHYAEAAALAGRGLLFLMPHLGCFDLAGQFIASRMPTTALYRTPRQPALEPFLRSGRCKFNARIAPTDRSGVRLLLKALRNRNAVILLPDQVPGNGEGVWAPFFGRLAYTMTLAVRLAETGASVLLIWAKRLPYGAGYRVQICPLRAPFSGSLEDRCAQLNAEMETLIRRCPEQYLWAYNRYKRPAGAPSAL